MSDATLELDAPRRWWSVIRDAVSYSKARGLDVRMVEREGWFRREFVVSGTLDGVRHVRDQLRPIFRSYEEVKS